MLICPITHIDIVRFADRILDTEQGQLTCIMGTVYGDLEFKPNVLKELASDVREHFMLVTNTHCM